MIGFEAFMAEYGKPKLFEDVTISILLDQMIFPKLRYFHPTIEHIKPMGYNAARPYFEHVGEEIVDHFKSDNSPFIFVELIGSGKSVGHWVSHIFYKHDNKLYIVTLDSFGHANTNREMLSFLEENKENLQVESIRVVTKKSDPEYIKQYHQSDLTSCGPYALYNIELNFGLVKYHDTEERETIEKIRDRYTEFLEKYSVPVFCLDKVEEVERENKFNEYLQLKVNKEDDSVIELIESGKIKGIDTGKILNVNQKHNQKNQQPITPKEATEHVSPQNHSTTQNLKPNISREDSIKNLLSSINNIRSYDKEVLVKLLQSSNAQIPSSIDKITNILEKRAINDFSSFSAFCKSIYELFTRIYYGEKLLYKNADEQKFSLKSGVNQVVIDALLDTIKTEPSSTTRHM